MIVLNRANDHLHWMVDAIEAFCEIRGCEPSDIEVKNTLWGVEDRLVIMLEIDRNYRVTDYVPSCCECSSLQVYDWNRMLCIACLRQLIELADAT